MHLRAESDQPLIVRLPICNRRWLRLLPRSRKDPGHSWLECIKRAFKRQQIKLFRELGCQYQRAETWVLQEFRGVVARLQSAGLIHHKE